MNRFREDIHQSYTFHCPSFRLGTAILDGNIVTDASISVPLCTFNRHGLIAGATGTGKTKTLQLLAENLSDHGVPVLLLDIKGDLSGLGRPGTINEKIVQRYEKMTTEKWSPKEYPVEFLTISEEKGIRLRTTIKEFGPMLLAKIMDLNETQTSVISVIFQFCQDQNFPLMTLKDFLTIVQYISNDGREEVERIYGKIAQASLGIIVRKTMELQQENVDQFFGEPAFDIRDFLSDYSSSTRGKIFILRVTDIQEKNKLFSTVMLSLLRKLYQSMPEIGDTDKPKFVMFIDEAHLLFQQTIEPLRQQIETTIKLIRSKGVGILFSTQNPTDIPASILAQLGMKIQHALRATTAKDRKNIKQSAENFPISTYYRVDQLLTELSIGEAFVTFLNQNGQPTMLAICMMFTPRSRLNILEPPEINTLVSQSALVAKYAQIFQRENLEMILARRIPLRSSQQIPMKPPKMKKTQRQKVKTMSSVGRSSTLEQVLNSATSREIGRTAAQVFSRGLFNTIGVTPNQRRHRRRR